MGILKLEDEVTQVILEVVLAVAALQTLCLFLFHVTYSCCGTDTNQIHRLSVWALGLVLIASILIFVSTHITIYNSNTFKLPLSQVACEWILLTVRLSFVYSKTLGLYVVYIERIIHIFKNNVYAFTKREIFSLRAIILLVTAAASMILIKSNSEVVHYLPSKQGGDCRLDNPIHLLLIIIIIDFVICNLMTVVYCRKLLIFWQRLNTRYLTEPASNAQNPNPNTPNLDADTKYYNIMVKSTVLTFIASISTQSTFIFVYIMGISSMWCAMDCIVISWCLILIFDLYDNLFNLYAFCCGLCEKLLCYHCILFYSCHYCFRVTIRGPALSANVQKSLPDHFPSSVHSLPNTSSVPTVNPSVNDGLPPVSSDGDINRVSSIGNGEEAVI